MADTKVELIETIEKKAARFFTLAKVEEVIFWIGSALSAICSAVAGLSIAADIGSWRSETGTHYGTIVAAALAIVPAVWIAGERSLNLRRLSLHNYAAATQMASLVVEARYTGDVEAKDIAIRYAKIIEMEYKAFAELILSLEGEGSSGHSDHNRTTQSGSGP